MRPKSDKSANLSGKVSKTETLICRRLEIFCMGGELLCLAVGFEAQSLSAEHQRLLQRARPAFRRMTAALLEVQARQEARRRARAAVKA